MNDRKTEKRGLGRGLSALMADVNLAPSALSGPRATDVRVPVEKIRPNPNQPRRDFDEQGLQDLAASIRSKGIIQPLIVREAEPGEYQIVAGERRWRAAQLAQVHEVPVIVRSLTDEEVLEVAIVENIQRADLNAIEEALAYRQLMERFGHTQDRMAEALARSRSHIANTLRLLQLPDDVQAYIREGKLTAGHARALVPTPNASELARQIIARGLTVRQAEELAKETMRRASVPRNRGGAREKDADTRALEMDLSTNLGMSVTINHDAGGNAGTLSIRYNSLEDLDLLCRGLSQLPRDGSV